MVGGFRFLAHHLVFHLPCHQASPVKNQDAEMTETKKQPDESAPPLHSESAEPRPDTEIPEGSKDIPEQVELMEVKALAS